MSIKVVAISDFHMRFVFLRYYVTFQVSYLPVVSECISALLQFVFGACISIDCCDYVEVI